MSIEELIPNEKNVRIHPQKQIEELKKSYKMFGQYRPLVVDSTGIILVGNGLYTALKEMGEKTVNCYVLPKNAKEDYKKKLMLADNKIYDLGKDDLMNIDDILPTLSDFEIPGFDESVLTELYSDIDEDAFVSVSGIIEEERVNKIKEVETKREENPIADDISKYEVKKEVADMYKENEDNTRYITCPHCGVKVYVDRS